ncbi:tRNA (guanosine(46)-N7)-methyltransferase TrmB, partial [Enterococcus faecalis]
QERFGNNHPIHIEIGSGKGRFIYVIARGHPEINYIGIDMQLRILSIALDKLVGEPLPNVQLLREDGEALTEYFAENELVL